MQSMLDYSGEVLMGEAAAGEINFPGRMLLCSNWWNAS